MQAFCPLQKFKESLDRGSVANIVDTCSRAPVTPASALPSAAVKPNQAIYSTAAPPESDSHQRLRSTNEMNNEAVTSEQTVVLQQQMADPSPILPIFGDSEVFPANYEEQVVPDRHFQVNDVINVSVEDDFRIESSQPNAFETCLDTLQRHGEKLDVSEPVSSRDVEPINEPNIEPNVPSSFILASPVRSAQDWIRYPAGYASSNTVKRSRAGRDLDTPRKVTASVQPTPASKSALQLFLEREDDNFSRMCCERDAVNPSCVATSGSWNDSTVKQEACVVSADRPPPHLDVATRLSLPLSTE